MLLFAALFLTQVDEDVIVVSGSKVEQSVDSSVEKVNVISSEKLGKKDARTVAESLSSIPGVVLDFKLSIIAKSTVQI